MGELRTHRSHTVASGDGRIAVWACLALVGCGSDKTPILEDDPPSVVALKEAGADINRVAVSLIASNADDMMGRNIDLSDVDLSPDVLENLALVPDANDLKFGADVSDEAMEAVSKLEKLATLDLSGSNVSDDSLKHLSSLKKLTVINLTDTQITGDGLVHLPPQLGVLTLFNVPIDDSDLENLQHLNRLQLIVIKGTKITQEGVNKLKEKRGGLIVMGVPSG